MSSHQINHALRIHPSLTSSFGGGWDLAIHDDAKPNDTHSNFGNSYELPQGMIYGSDEARSYLAGSNKFQVKEFEVYSVTILE